jgi:predicted nucleic acid-binding Zn ribbon protein
MCDREYELYVGYDQDEFPKCEDCSITLSKVFTPPAIHFKGGGWGGSHGGQ